MKFLVDRPVVVIRTLEVEAKSEYDAESIVRDGWGTFVDEDEYYPERVRADLLGTLPVTFKIKARRKNGN